MFDHLVESTSHKEDLGRKGSFILGTLVIYGVLGLALGITSIVWYKADLDTQNLELTTLVAPVPIPPQQEPDKPQPAKPQKTTPDIQVAQRSEAVARVDMPLTPKDISATASKVPPIPKGNYVITGKNVDVEATGPIVPNGIRGGTGGAAPPKVESDEPPPPEPKPSPKPKTIVSGGVLNGKAISLPQPPYPPIARSARASGTVIVQVTIDESGKVVSAVATSGHPLLRAAAVQAAYGARFQPTKLSGQPVKVTGVIQYNFTL